MTEPARERQQISLAYAHALRWVAVLGFVVAAVGSISSFQGPPARRMLLLALGVVLCGVSELVLRRAHREYRR